MKRAVSVFAVLVFIVLLSSCDSGRSNHEDRINFFLEDFDYMIALMEDTFPHFGVAERRLGIDIRELADSTRDIIKNYPASMAHIAYELGLTTDDLPDMNALVFWSILRYEFFDHFAPLGNTAVLDYNEHSYLMSTYTLAALATSQAQLHRLLIFFGEDDPPLPRDIEAPSTGLPYFHHNATVFTNNLAVGFYRNQRLSVLRYYEECPETLAFLFRSGHPQQSEDAEVFTTKIIEEGSVAYLQLTSFNVRNFRNYSPALDRFFNSVSDFEHLIIDIRDCRGIGRNDFWRMLIMYPLWYDHENMPEKVLYAFYRDTEHSIYLAHAHIGTEKFATRFVPASAYPIPIDVIMTQNSSLILNEDDSQHLSHGVRLYTGLNHLSSNQFHFTQEQMWIPRGRFPFAGQIWLLTSESNTAFAAHFARHAKHTDFAIIVGEPTGGGYTSTVLTHFLLPNSGIIVRWDIDYLVDEYGRSLEEFPTQPHIFSPAAYALDTVLELISSR